MRLTPLMIVTALAIGSAGGLLPSRAEAVPFGAPAGVRLAIQDVDPVETAGCWRYGWRGYGWYRWCGYHRYYYHRRYYRHYYYRPYYHRYYYHRRWRGY